MVVTEDEDVVYHKLPGGKRKRTTVVHDLMAAVNSGKRTTSKEALGDDKNIDFNSTTFDA